MMRAIAVVRLSCIIVLYATLVVPFSTYSSRPDARIRKRGKWSRWDAFFDVVRATQESLDDDGEMPPTVIGRGSKITAEMFTSTNSIIVEGELNVQRLECCQQASIHVTSTGTVKGQIYGGILVTVDGKLEGSVECFELVVGPGGMVTGDVICKDVIIRPGGIIGGQLSCENMKSERDVFNEVKSPLSEVVYKSNERTVPPRDNVVAALKAMSDRQTTNEVPVNNMITDDYGHPLIAAATNEQVLSLRRNREEIFATRNFLDKAMTRKAELPEWVHPTSTGATSLNKKEEEKYALKNVLNKKTQASKMPPNQTILTSSLPPNVPSQGAMSRSRPTQNNDDASSRSPAPPKEEKRIVESLLKKKADKSDNDYDTLPDFLR